MAAQLDRLAANTALIKGLQLTTLSTLAVVSGIATSLYVWVIPIIQTADNARTKARQFNLTIEKGVKYLLPTGKLMSACLTSLGLLHYRNSNPNVAARWKVYALALSGVITVMPWEIYTIFPMNDRMEVIEEEFNRPDSIDSGKESNAEVDDILVKWQQRHIVRIVAPVGAFLTILWSIISEQKL